MSRALIGLLIAGFLIVSGMSVYEHRRLTTLSEAHSQLASELRATEQHRDEIASGLGDRIDSLEAKLESVSNQFAQSAVSSDTTEASSSDPPLLEPGIHVLNTKIAQGESEATNYTIYHVATTVQAEDFTRDIQFGAARSSVLNWRFYFDHNSDGRVDMDILREFADSLPFGGLVSGSFAEDASQQVYDSFLGSAGLAEYTPIELISEDAGIVAQRLWAYIEDRSAELALWIRETRNESSVED